MKRILLCCPFTKGDLFTTRWVTPHYGLWRLASYLNANGQFCEVYDVHNPKNIGTFEEIVKEGNWDFIGFSILEATVEYDLSKVFKAKEISPSSVMIAGGSGAALNYQFILDNSPIEIVFIAEGEKAMLQLCTKEKWSEIEGVVIKRQAPLLKSEDFWEYTKTLDVDKMGVDDYWKRTASLYENPDYNEINTFRLFTSNYCPMGCKFCTLTLWKKYSSGCMPKVVGLTPEQIIEMIKKAVVAYPTLKQIYFTDDDFFILRAERERFCELVIEEKEKGLLPKELSFIIMTNINRFSEYNINLMVKMGVRVLSVGVESTSQHKLDTMAKKQKVETIWRNTQLIINSGIKPYYTLLLFTPYETIEDTIEDLSGFRRLSSMGVGISVEPYLIPLPGTPFWEEHVPMSSRWIPIEGTNKKIHKGFAWLPVDKRVRAVFDSYEKWYPKYKKYRFDLDGVGHKEKNYQGGVILDALEIVLRVNGYTSFKGKFGLFESRRIFDEVDQLKVLNVDIVGDFTQ